MDKWINSRLPSFPNDGENFENFGDGNRSRNYIDLVADQGNSAARRTNKNDDDLKRLQMFYGNLEVYNQHEAWEKFLQGKQVFESYLFNGLGLSKTKVDKITDGIQGIYEAIAKEIDKGHVIPQYIKLTEDNIGNMEILNDDKWEAFKGFRLTQGIDLAMVGKQRTGGIDLTPANMNLETQNGDEEIKFHLDPAQLAQLQNAPGFVPVIINIQPMTNLKQFLGLK